MVGFHRVLISVLALSFSLLCSLRLLIGLPASIVSLRLPFQWFSLHFLFSAVIRPLVCLYKKPIGLIVVLPSCRVAS